MTMRDALDVRPAADAHDPAPITDPARDPPAAPSAEPGVSPAGAVASGDWQISLRSGHTLCVPPSTQSLTTHVLLEQEAWFESEMSLLPLLLTPGMHVLDIGANHGVYTLEMARCTGDGRVIAFEPTAEPRARLVQSVALNGLQDRVHIVAAGLSDAAGTASFAVGSNSELNSRGGSGSTRETVALLSLDDYLAAHARGLQIGFVKLDAEGDEARVIAGARDFFMTQSPVVLFEFRHGQSVNMALVGAWQALGFDLFRWSAELELLLPFDAARDELAFALNLLAVRPAQQADLEARGLLLSRAMLAASPAIDLTLPLPPVAPASLQAWCAMPAMQGLPADAATDPVAGGSGVYAACLQAVVAAHLDTSLQPAERLARFVAVRAALQSAADGSGRLPLAGWALLVHVLQALGAVQASQQLAVQILKHGPQASALQVPFVPPRLSDLARRRSTDPASWLRQMLGEHVELRSAYSSYFRPPQPQHLAALLKHPDHAVEFERRYLLARMRSGDCTPLAPLLLLPDARHTRNSRLWRGLLASMRSEAAPPSEAPGDAGGAPHT